MQELPVRCRRYGTVQDVSRGNVAVTPVDAGPVQALPAVAVTV